MYIHKSSVTFLMWNRYSFISTTTPQLLSISFMGKCIPWTKILENFRNLPRPTRAILPNPFYNKAFKAPYESHLLGISCRILLDVWSEWSNSKLNIFKTVEEMHGRQDFRNVVMTFYPCLSLVITSHVSSQGNGIGSMCPSVCTLAGEPFDVKVKR